MKTILNIIFIMTLLLGTQSAQANDPKLIINSTINQDIFIEIQEFQGNLYCMDHIKKISPEKVMMMINNEKNFVCQLTHHEKFNSDIKTKLEFNFYNKEKNINCRTTLIVYTDNKFSESHTPGTGCKLETKFDDNYDIKMSIKPQ